ncbi:hypothetical protein F66182_5126 [Fusarium sp. NRRL 66182]|nr:hypothetical protein F66182_5126 [Fusarium sp. NRRL 66182]
MKDRTSNRINFPRYSQRIPRRPNATSGYYDLMGRAVLISIVNYLADLADAVEDIKLPKQHKDRTRLKNDQRKLCETIVNGTNTLTALFNSAKGQSKYTDPTPKNLPLYRDEIRGRLLDPLQKANASKMINATSFSFAPFQQKLSALLNGIEDEVRFWLRIPHANKPPTKPHDQRTQRSSAKSHDQKSSKRGHDHQLSKHGHSKGHSKSHPQSRSSSPESSGPCIVM